MSYFEVRDSRGMVLPGLPSPRLIQEGGGWAYRGVSNYWRLRDDSYDTPGTEYTRVTIIHVDDYRVDVEIRPILEAEGDLDSYEDYFIVQAATEQEAFRKAEAMAVEDVESRYGEEYGSEVTVIRARKGVSI